MADLNRTLRRGIGVEAQGDLVPDQGGIDLVDHAVEAHGAVLLYFAFGLEEEQIIEVQRRLRETHRLAGERPLLQRRGTVEPAARDRLLEDR